MSVERARDHGQAAVRDLWRQKDLGTFDGEFSTVVPRHGTVFVRVARQ